MVMAPALQRCTGAPPGVWTQVSVLSSHESMLHPLPSLQGFGVVTHWPLAGLHVSVVQNRPSLQTIGVPGMQVGAWQVSTPLQGLPSLQSASTVQTPIVAKTPPETCVPAPGDVAPMGPMRVVAPVARFTLRSSGRPAVALYANM